MPESRLINKCVVKIFRGFSDVSPIRGALVTIGSFDGLHLGHRQLLSHLVEEAHRRGGESVVLTFDPHPRRVVDPDFDFRLLSTTSEKELLMAETGVDNLLFIPFDKEFSRIDYATFVKDYLVGRLGMEAMVVGYNHRFGRGAEGGGVALAALARELGFEVSTVPQLLLGSAKISSTELRRIIAEEGNMALACSMLSRPYLMLAQWVESGVLSGVEDGKLFPPAGDYLLMIDGCEAVATLDGNGVVRVKSGYQGESMEGAMPLPSVVPQAEPRFCRVEFLARI